MSHRTHASTPVLALALALLAGCASGSGTRHAADDAPAPLPAASADADPVASLGYQLQWKGQPVLGRGATVRFLDIFDDAIGIHDSSNTMTIMEKTTGRNRWSDKIWPDVSRHVGTVQLPSGDLLCSRMTDAEIRDVRTGELEARQDLAVIANTRPVVAGRIAVFGTVTGELLGHNILSGYKQWGYAMGASINAAPVRIGRNVGAVAQNGRVLIADPATGRSISTTEIFEGVETELAASNNTLFVASTDQSLWAFGDTDADVLWRIRTSHPLTDPPAYHDGTVYCAIPREGMVAFDALTGERRWVAPDVRGAPVGIRAHNLLVWDPPRLVAIDARTGDISSTVELPGVFRIALDGFADADLYLAWPEGPVAKYSPR